MKVIDVNNNSYTILRKIGEGSQGDTYLLEDNKHIVKLFKSSFNTIENKSKINFLINLDLDKDLFSIPLRQITQPRNGYVAEFASGMVPLSSLKNPIKTEDFKEWFLKTGGLIKRYNILIRLALILRKLHSKGLIYCDLSLENVFVSEKSEKSNVFLIDVDNLKYKSSITQNIYSPFYGAPEVILNLSPNTIMSDSYSFGVLAYELLTFNHPLIGDYVTEGEPELEEMALEGKIPWVEDQNDGINYRSTGLPTSKVISENLLKLFQRNFEVGLNNPLQRPSMAEWYEVLLLAKNKILKCDNCNLAYPYENSEKCTFCDTAPKKVTRIHMCRWEEDSIYNNDLKDFESNYFLDSTIYDEIIMSENTPKTISASHFLYDLNTENNKIFSIEYLYENNEEKLLLTPLNGHELLISPREVNVNNLSTRVITKPQKIRVVNSNNKLMIHLKPLNEPQRVLTID